MTTLLDINVLVALAWPNHVHHATAIRQFGKLTADGWATCAVTQAGFVRVSSNSRVLPDARSPGECVLLLRRLTALPGHVFWDDTTDLTASPHLALEKIVGHRQVTDAHLLAVALAHGGRLGTFDRGLRALLPGSIRPDDAVLLFG